MPQFSAAAAAINNYVVEAVDAQEALDTIFDMVKADLQNADAYEVANISEVI